MQQKTDCMMRVWQSSTRGPHEVIEADPYLQAMHANAEQFDASTERLFRYLQASTDCPLLLRVMCA